MVDTEGEPLCLHFRQAKFYDLLQIRGKFLSIMSGSRPKEGFLLDDFTNTSVVMADTREKSVSTDRKHGSVTAHSLYVKVLRQC